MEGKMMSFYSWDTTDTSALGLDSSSSDLTH